MVPSRKFKGFDLCNVAEAENTTTMKRESELRRAQEEDPFSKGHYYSVVTVWAELKKVNVILLYTVENKTNNSVELVALMDDYFNFKT